MCCLQLAEFVPAEKVKAAIENVSEIKEAVVGTFKVQLEGAEEAAHEESAQTEGKELPDIAVDELTGDVERYKDFFTVLEKTSPVSLLRTAALASTSSGTWAG